VFFLNACKQNGIDCNPSCGDEDVMGADFYLTYGKETRFFDVTTNTFAKSVSKKVREGTFPSLFIPWAYRNNGKPSYAEDYLREGKFNGTQFLHNILDVNYVMLDSLRRKVWRNQDVDRKLFGDEVLDLSRCGIQYLNHLDGILYLIRKAM